MQYENVVESNVKWYWNFPAHFSYIRIFWLNSLSSVQETSDYVFAIQNSVLLNAINDNNTNNQNTKIMKKEASD